MCVWMTRISNSSLPTTQTFCSKTWVFVSWAHVCQRTHLCMLLGTQGHVVDELSGAAKVCTLSSPSACKKNGSFTSFFWAALLLSKTNGRNPPATSPPLCGRQVAMLLAFTIGRHTQKRWVRKDSSPFLDILSILFYTLGLHVCVEASPSTSVTLYNTYPKTKSKGGLIALQYMSACVNGGHIFYL